MPTLTRAARTGLCTIILAAAALTGCVAPAQSGGDLRPRLTTVGAATMVGNGLRLVPAQHNATGAAWSAERLSVAKGFDATFSFQVTQCDSSLGGGDGFAFVIQNCDAYALGAFGGGMGYGGFGRHAEMAISNSLVVEFDTFANSWDPNGNHISVQTRGTERNAPDHKFSLGAATDIPNLKDGKCHLVKISYRTPGTLSVYIDQFRKPALVVAVDLNKTLRLSMGRAWLGFTAATAIAYENVQILTWSFTPIGQ